MIENWSTGLGEILHQEACTQDAFRAALEVVPMKFLYSSSLIHFWIVLSSPSFTRCNCIKEYLKRVISQMFSYTFLKSIRNKLRFSNKRRDEVEVSKRNIGANRGECEKLYMEIVMATRPDGFSCPKPGWL